MRGRVLSAFAAAAILAAVSAFAQDAATPARTLTTAKETPLPSEPARAPAARTPQAPSAKSTGGEAITLAADTSKGFARILFRWPSPVTFDAAIQDGILVVTFARPFRLPGGGASLPLDSYVSVIRQDANMRTLRLSLKQKVRLHTSAGGPLVAIDLLPATFAGEPGDVADPTVKPPPPPTGAVAVKLNIGVTEDRTRLAFDWGEQVKYEAKYEPGKIKVSFAREGKIDIGRLNENPPAFVKGARISAGDARTLLEIDVDPGSPVKDFRNKTRIVFDVGAPVNDRDSGPQIVLPEGLAPEPQQKPHDVAEADPHAAKPAPDGEEPAGEGHEVPPAEDAHAPPPQDLRGEAEGNEPKAEEHKAPAEAADDKKAPADAHAEPAHDAAPAEAPPFKAERSGTALVLTLPVLDGDAAAMFKRGSTVFILMDGEREIDASAFARANKDVVASASSGLASGATVLTITLGKPYVLTAGQQKHGWTATLSPDPLEPPRPVALVRDARSVGAGQIRATLRRATRIVRMIDPDSGEALIAVLAAGEPQGVLGGRNFVEFAADPTAQGLLVRPFADDLSVKPEAEDVVISAPGGLTLSAGAAADRPLGRPSIGSAAAPAAMDLAAWGGSGAFLEERSHRVNAIQPDGHNIDAARLALARFYLARDLGAEAFGQLQMMLSADEALAGDPAFRALRGSALILLGRFDAAAEELATPALDDDPNAQLLRGLAQSGLGNWSAARDSIVRGEDVIAGFRPDWQARFRLAGAHAAAETNAVDIAGRMLEGMPKDGVPRPLRLEGDLVRGLLAQKLKKDDEALKLYASVMKSGYRPLAVRATLADIVLQEKTGALKRDAAIGALDRLRWQWRGDDLELTVLHRLGGLQVASGDYRSGLQTMRSAVLGFPKADETREISAEMEAIFTDLFLNGKADALPPVQALGLYYDFKELTPIGSLGDDMVRRLADRLITVDLLEQAAELLQHQVDKRLDGVARAQIAAKLAAVYLMDRKPEKALAALRSSQQTRLPDALAAQRRLLTGRALSDLKQYDAALDAFEQDETPEAYRLRADVQWAGGHWPETAAALEVLLAGREKAGRPLDAGERSDVLRAAVAYTMAENEDGLSNLRDRFIVLMADAPEAAAFEMVTRAVDPSGVEFRDLAKAVAATDTLDVFLQSLGLGKPAGGSASAK